MRTPLANNYNRNYSAYPDVCIPPPGLDWEFPNPKITPTWLGPDTVRRYPHDTVYVHTRSVDLVR